MRRLLYGKLKEWKNSPFRKPLLLDGARQVGKTWLLKEFGNKEYDSCAYITCDKNKNIQELFNGSFDTQKIITSLSVLSKTKIMPDKTLIILDEIQEAPAAISSLKYFCENCPEYHVAAAGSLLGIKTHQGTGFPVGKVNTLKLYPLSFMEFLTATGNEMLAEMVAAHHWSDTNPLSETLKGILKQYYFTGGMPEAVMAFARGDAQDVRSIQKEILRNYSTDFSKHISSDEVPKTRLVWNSIPSQLAKENKKFIYSAIRKGARAKDFENAIQWLSDAGLIHTVTKVKKIEKPLKFYEDFSCFKLFISDIGLLGAMSDISEEDILLPDSTFTMYKGSFTEQYFAQQYLSATGGAPLFYYANDNSTSEIDFVFQNGNAYPCEVKAETNLRAKSMSTILKSSPNLKGLRFSMSGYKEQSNLTNIPLYLAEEYIKAVCSK